MNLDFNHINQYSLTDIQKYLEGELSDADMHVLEKAALDDPFLADAIDGVYNNLQHQHGSYDADMDDLKKRLAERIAAKDKTKVVLLSSNRNWWKIAAAVVVLLGVSAVTFTYFMNHTGSVPDIVLNKEVAVADSTAADEPKPAGAAGNSIASAEKKQSSSSTSTLEKKARAFYEKAKNEDSIGKETVLKNNKPAIAAAAGNVRADSLHISDSISKPAIANATVEKALQGKVAGVDIQRSRATNTHFFEGKVVDENNKPVRGATVALKNKKNATVTDDNGLFKLITGGKDTVVHVLVNSVGFQTASVALNTANAPANLVQLQPNSAALNEVVVTGSETTVTPGELRKEKTTAQKASPSTGWEDFNRYLAKNKKITTPDSTQKGRESISFIVHKTGALSSFKIIHSLSPAHDAEAIRLVKEGPSWKLRKGNKARVIIDIEF